MTLQQLDLMELYNKFFYKHKTKGMYNNFLSRNSHRITKPTPPYTRLALPPLEVQVVGEPSALSCSGENTLRRRRDGGESNLRVDVEQRLALAAWRPDSEGHVVLLEVFAVEGAVEGQC